MRRRFFTAVLGVSCTAGLFLLACSDDDTTTNDAGTGTDAATADTSTNPGSDGGAKADTGSPGTDSGADATPANDAGDAGDSGPTKTTETVSTGIFRIGSLYAQALFSQDDTVIRWSNAPNCIGISKSAGKPLSQAGTVKVGGQIVGKDGGTPDAIEINGPDYYYDGVVLPLTSEFTVDISEGPATPAFPALPTQTLRPSPAAAVTVSPLADAGSGELPLGKGQPLVIKWTVPSGDITDQRFTLDLLILNNGSSGSKDTELICDESLSAGTFTVPANVLADLAAETLPITGTPVAGPLLFRVGGQKVVTIKNAVYILTAATDESTTSLSQTLVLQ